MPTKCRELHAHIHPRYGHPTYLLIILLTDFEDRPRGFIDIIQIEKGSRIVKMLVSGFGSFELGEPRSILMSRQISSIFYGDLILFLQFGISDGGTINDAPILALHLWLSGKASFFEAEAILSFEVLCILREWLNIITLYFLVECLSLLQSVDFLNSCGYPLFSIFKIESGVPLGTCPDFNSPVILVLLLKFQDQVEGVAFHLGFGKSY